MITRRRGRNNMDVRSPCSPLEVEVMSVSDMTEDVKTSPLDDLPTDHVDTSELELDDLFGMDEVSWTFEGDSVSPLFDIGLGGLGVGDSVNGDSGIGGSMSPSPERGRGSPKRKHPREDPTSMTNKNAIAARVNRLKKKEYVTGLERTVGNLSTENRSLKQENGHLNKRVEELEDETRYLRAVLANESMLAQLLSRLSGVNGMKLSSSLFQGSKDNDHDYALPRKRVKVEEKETSGGVCLHVDKDHVSVEFCTKCAESASASLKM